MNATQDFDRRLSDFYVSEAPDRAPDWVLGAALGTIETTKQRRVGIRVPWRFSPMTNFAKVAVAAVAVVAVGAVGLTVLNPNRSPGSSTPTPSPSASASSPASPSATETLPPLTGSFTSPMYGYSTSYPAGWSEVPGDKPWTFPTSSCEDLCLDEIRESGPDNAFLRVASQPLGSLSGEEWATRVLTDPSWGDTCDPGTESVTIDGSAGVIAVHCPDPVLSATTSAGGRGYFFVLYGPYDQNDFKDILATVQLLPEDAVDAAPSGSPASSP